MSKKESANKNSDKNFILDAMRMGLRLDGRSFLETREFTIQTNPHNGSCIVKLGKTKAFAVVSAEVSRSNFCQQHEGRVFFNIVFSSLTITNFNPGKADDVAVILTCLIERSFTEAQTLDLEALCIVSGCKVKCNHNLQFASPQLTSKFYSI